jgi:hypothetical protein
MSHVRMGDETAFDMSVSMNSSQTTANGSTGEGAARNLVSMKELSFIDEGLWGFEITDADGYVLAFFRVRDK